MAPLAPTVSGPTGTVAVNTATITITPAEAGGTLQGSLDGAAYATVTSPVNLTGLSNGSHTYSARQVDAAGNLGAVASITWIVNTAVPLAPTINTGPTGTVASTSASFTFSTSESGMTFECRIDGAAYAACTSPQAYSSLAQGAHTFDVRAVNGASTPGPAASRTWTVDTVAPNAPTVSGPTGTVAVNTATITITPAEAGGTLQGSLDGAAYATVTSPVNLTGLSQGSHTYNARQVDAAGNVGAVGTVTWTVDSVAPNAPTVSRTAPTANPTTSASQTIGITPAEAGGTLQGSLDGAAYATVTSPVNLTGLSNGSHTYSARQIDSAGNIGAVGSVTWTVDLVVPNAPTLSGVSGIVGSTSASITITPAEAGGTLQGSLDGASFATVTSPVGLTGLSQGSHTYSARQVDAAGNVGSVGTITWTVDTVAPPAPTVSTPPSGSSTSASITFSDTEAGVTFQCSLNGAAFAACTSPVNLTGLAAQTHTFAVRALDGATPANVSSATTVTWTVTSAVAPNTILGDALPALPTLTPTIPVSSDQGSATFECQVNDLPVAWATCDPNTGTYGSGLTFNNDATNKVEIRATLSGTPDATPVTTYIWTSNAAAPSATATVTPSTTQAGANPNLTSTVTLAGGWNPKSVTIDVAPGFNAGLTAVSTKCTFNADPNAMACGTSAPGSFLGTLSGTGVSTSAGFLTDATGNLYMTTSPSANSPAGVWLDMASPSHPELGRIRATAEARIIQTNNGTSQGLVQQQLIINSVPQRTNNGSRFHINSVTLNLQGDPPGGTYPLLTNPTSCPGTPVNFSGIGTTYGTDGLDTSSGPAVPQVLVPYPVTGCASLPFQPQINMEYFGWDPIDGSTADYSAPVVQSVGSALYSNDSLNFTRLGEFGVEAAMTLPSGSKMIKDITSYQPAGVGANLPAFGSAAQKCTGTGVTATAIWPGTCPASGIAEVGYMTITTPLLDQ
ncbi:MAG: hypothetical protein HYX29_02425, partial [Solirubrobacterales bacterium]|nr:hypothetical protein [Solirubrobacterales bacterium]